MRITLPCMLILMLLGAVAHAQGSTTYDGIAWDFGTDIHNNITSALSAWGYGPVTISCDMDGMDYASLKTPSELNAMLGGDKMFYLSQHAGQDGSYICYWYFPPNDAIAAWDKAFDLVDPDWCPWDCNCWPNVPGHSNPLYDTCEGSNSVMVFSIRDSNHNVKAWAVGYSGWADRETYVSPMTADAIIIVNACDAFTAHDHFTNMYPTSYVYVAPDVPISRDHDPGWKTFFNRLGCVGEKYNDKTFLLEHVSEAINGDANYPGSPISWLRYYPPGGGNLTLNCETYCVSEPARFRAAYSTRDSIYWYVDSSADARGYDVIGVSESAEHVVAQVPVKGNKGDRNVRYAVERPHAYIAFEIVERVNYGIEVRSGIFDDRSAARMMFLDRDKLMPPLRRNTLTTQDSGQSRSKSSTEWGIGTDVLIVARAGLSTECLQDQLDEMGKEYCVEVVYDAAPTDDVQERYETIVEGNAFVNNAFYGGEEIYPENPGPLLIIVAPMGASCSYGINAVMFPLSEGGYGRSDYLYTDYDGDGHPNGPVTRIPAGTVSDLQEMIAGAGAINSGSGLATQKTVLIMEDDLYEDYDDECHEIMNAYRQNGYIPRGPIVTSDLPELYVSRFGAFSGYMNEGIREVIGRGYYSQPWAWCDILRTDRQNDEIYSGLAKAQAFVAYMPMCNTAICGLYEDGDYREYYENPVWARMMLSRYGGSQTKLACFVGHYEYGYKDAFEKYTKYLLEERFEQANVSVQDVAYAAVARMCDDGGRWREHALSVGVLGSYTICPDYRSTVDVRADNGSDVSKIDRVSDREVWIRVYGGMYDYVDVTVYDLRGRRIREVYSGSTGGRDMAVRWQCDDESRRLVGSGVYIVRVIRRSESGERTRTHKISITR